MNWIFYFLLSILLSACTNAKRAPNSDVFDEERIHRIQEIDLEPSRFWNYDWRANQEVLSFFSQGRKITDKEKISWINSTLIDWADSYF